MKICKSRKVLNLIILVVTLSLVSTIAACSGGTSKQDGTTTAETKTTQPATSETTQAQEPEEFDPFGKFDPPVKVRIGYAPGQNYDFNEGQTPYDNVWKDLYAEHGINVEVMYVVDISQADTKMRTSIASGDYPDIIPAKPIDYHKFATTGVLADITEVFEKYKEGYSYLDYYVNTDGGNALAASYIGGKLYGIPFLTNPYDYIDLLWIRKDWLDNLKLELPKTMEDVEKIAIAFTNNDPDQNNRKDTYGIAFAGKNFYTTVGGFSGFFAGFDAFPGFLNVGADIYIKNPNGSDLIWGGDLPGMTPAFEMLQRLYKAGAIASDLVTMDSAKIYEELQGGKAGMYFGPTWANYMISQVVKNNPKADFVQIPVPSMTPGEPAKPILRNSLSYLHCISSKAENPEALLKMWCLTAAKMNSEDVNEIYKYFKGREGGAYQYFLSGLDAREPIGSLQQSLNVTEAFVKNDPSVLAPLNKDIYDGIVAYNKAVAEGKFDPANNDADVANWLFKKMYGPDSSEDTIAKLKDQQKYTPSMYMGPPTEAMDNYVADLTTFTQQEMLKIIMCQQPVSHWEEVVKQYYARGGTAILKDVNEWYSSR